MDVILVGGGRLLFFLCRSLVARGFRPTVVNKDEEECVRLSRRIEDLAVVRGDGSDPDVLKEAGADVADIVLAVTPNDHDNLVIAQIAARHFSVSRAIAMVNDPDNEDAFRRLGVEAFSLTRLMANLITQRTEFEEIADIIPMDEGRVNVTEVLLGEESPVAEKQLMDVDFPKDALVACVIRDNLPIIPRGFTRLRAGDRVILITLPQNHEETLKTLLGE